MKRIYLSAIFAVGFMLFSLGLTAQSQNVPEILKERVGNFTLKQTPEMKVASQAISINPKFGASKADAKYSYPDAITHLFSCYDLETGGPIYGMGAHYMTFNSLINLFSETNYDYLFYYKDEAVFYWNETMATSYSWSIPGGTPATSTLQDIDVVYETAGRYNFPTMTVDGNTAGFERPGNVKVGGKAEISHINMYELGDTYSPSYYTFNNNAGWVSGSNIEGFEKFGNVYTLKEEGALLEAVSVYIAANPTAADPNNEVTVNVYAIGNSIDAELLGSSSLKISEMIAGASDITGIIGGSQSNPTEFMGLAYFEFDEPIELPDFFFITVENIGHDVAGGDKFVILMDTKAPVPTGYEDYLYGWNSFFFAETNQGTFAWMYYQQVFANTPGVDNATFYICPVINFAGGEGSGISKTKVPTSTVVSTPNSFELTYNAGFNSVEVYNLAGQVVAKQQLSKSGIDTLPVNLNKGIYMVKFIGATTETVKVVR